MRALILAVVLLVVPGLAHAQVKTTSAVDSLGRSKKTIRAPSFIATQDPAGPTTLTNSPISTPYSVTAKYLHATDPASASTLLGPLYLGTLAAGEVSAASVTATGTTKAATVAARAAREVWVTDFSGIDPTGATSSTAAIIAAQARASTVGAVLRIPKGTYRVDAGSITLAGNVVGDGADQVIFDVYGAGTSVVWNGGQGGKLEGLTLRSKEAGQSGLVVRSGTGVEVKRLRILDFDGTCLRIGLTGVAGVYFADVSYVECNDSAGRYGQIGVLVDSGVASSNANQFRNLFVKGGWRTYYDVRGNSNTFTGCDAEPNSSLTTVSEVIRFAGTGNHFQNLYLEPVGATKPDTYFRFESTANQNELRGIYSSSGGQEIDPRLADSGIGNDAVFAPVLDNFIQGVGRNVSGANLVANADLVATRSADGSPSGWYTFDPVAGATLTREADPDGTYMLKVDVTSAFYGFTQYLSTHQPTVRHTYGPTLPVAYFRGKTVSCTVEAKSTTAGCGNVKLNGAGAMRTLGTGAWERLAISTRISQATTEIPFQLRTDANSVAKTCTVWFRKPVCVLGREAPLYAPRPLADTGARMAGRFALHEPVTFTDGDTTPSVADGNFFTFANTTGITVTALDGGVAGQEVVLFDPGANTTLANNASIVTATGANRAMGTVPHRLIFDGSKWREF